MSRNDRVFLLEHRNFWLHTKRDSNPKYCYELIWKLGKTHLKFKYHSTTTTERQSAYGMLEQIFFLHFFPCRCVPLHIITKVALSRRMTFQFMSIFFFFYYPPTRWTIASNHEWNLSVCVYVSLTKVKEKVLLHIPFWMKRLMLADDAVENCWWSSWSFRFSHSVFHHFYYSWNLINAMAWRVDEKPLEFSYLLSLVAKFIDFYTILVLKYTRNT